MIQNRGKKYQIPEGVFSYAAKDGRIDLYVGDDWFLGFDVDKFLKALKVLATMFVKRVVELADQKVTEAVSTATVAEEYAAVKKAYEKARAQFYQNESFLKISLKDNLAAIERIAEAMREMKLTADEFFELAVEWRRTWNIEMEDFPGIKYFSKDEMINGVLSQKNLGKKRLKKAQDDSRFDEIKSQGREDANELTKEDLEYAAKKYGEQGLGVIDVGWLRKEMERRGMDYRDYKKLIVKRD